MKIIFVLYEMNIHGRIQVKLCKVCLKIFSSSMAKFKYMNGNFTTVDGEHSGNCKSITSIISFATKNLEWINKPAMTIKPFKTFCGCPFHQVNGSDRLMLYGILIP